MHASAKTQFPWNRTLMRPNEEVNGGQNNPSVIRLGYFCGVLGAFIAVVFCESVGSPTSRLQRNGWKGSSGWVFLWSRCGAFSQLLTLPTAAAWVTLVVATRRIHKNHACKGSMLATICRILKQKNIRHGSALGVHVCWRVTVCCTYMYTYMHCYRYVSNHVCITHVSFMCLRNTSSSWCYLM